jgi:hypothetical protein
MTDALRQLCALLADGALERADLLTTSVVLAEARRLDRGWLRLADGARLPDALLADLGSAWSDSTGELHGFRTQRRRYPLNDEESTDFVAMAVAFGWRSNPEGRPMREEVAAVPQYREFVAGGHERAGFFPTLRNPSVEDYVAWYDRWKRTVLAVHLRLADGDEES